MVERTNNIDDEKLEKVTGGGLMIDENGNKYYMDFGVNTDNCTGCGYCVESCPMSCMSFKNGVAYIDDEQCIRCGHCADMCPMGAIGDFIKVIVS